MKTPLLILSSILIISCASLINFSTYDVNRKFVESSSNSSIEFVYILGFSEKGDYQGCVIHSIGTEASCDIDKSLVMFDLFGMASKYWIVIHNHPSETMSFSSKDNETFQSLAQWGNSRGKPLIDFVIIGENTFVSKAILGEIKIKKKIKFNNSKITCEVPDRLKYDIMRLHEEIQ